MKEFEVTVKVRNNLLKERRLSLGFSQTDMAKAVGISLKTYLDLETMKKSPMGPNGWRECALVLAKFHCVEPEELFTDSIINIKKSETSMKLDSGEIGLLLEQRRATVLLPDAELNKKELRGSIERALEVITGSNGRDREIFRRRYGLDSGEPVHNQDLADEYGLCRQRISEIEKQGLRLIRPLLKDFED